MAHLLVMHRNFEDVEIIKVTVFFFFFLSFPPFLAFWLVA